MAIELINIGQIANDGTGDDLREAFIKVNANFEELDLRDDEQTSASNLGVEGEGIFAQKINYDLQFKKLVGSGDVTLSSDSEKIFIDADIGVRSIEVLADTGSLTVTDDAILEIKGGTDISTSVTGGILTIANTGVTTLASDPAPALSARLDAQDNNIINANTISAINVISLVHGIDIRDVNQKVNELVVDFDFGGIVQNVQSILEWLVISTDVDFGTLPNPDPRKVDNGLLV